MQQTYNELSTYKNSILSATKNLSDNTIYNIINNCTNILDNEKINKKHLFNIVQKPIINLYGIFLNPILKCIDSEITFFKNPDSLIENINNHYVPLIIPDNKVFINHAINNTYALIINYFTKYENNIGDDIKTEIKNIIDNAINNGLIEYKNVLYATEYHIQQININLVRRKTGKKAL